MNELDLPFLVVGFVVAVIVVALIGAAVGKILTRRAHAAWLAEQDEQYQKDYAFFGGAQWTPEQIAKMNKDMQNCNPLQFNRVMPKTEQKVD